MKIAVDAMGGDFAPEDVVTGAVEGAREYGVGIYLVGPNDRVEPELAKHDSSNLDIDLVHTEEYLVEGEAPAYALRKKCPDEIRRSLVAVEDTLSSTTSVN